VWHLITWSWWDLEPPALVGASRAVLVVVGFEVWLAGWLAGVQWYMVSTVGLVGLMQKPAGSSLQGHGESQCKVWRSCNYYSLIYCHELRFQAWTLQSSLFLVVCSSASSPCCNGLKLDERSWTMWIAFWGLILLKGSWPNCHEELCSGFFGSLLQARALETDTHHTLSTKNLASSLGSPFSSSSSPGRVFQGASYRVPGITSEPEKGRSSLEDEIKHVRWIQ